MKDATLKQAGKVLTLMENTPCEQLQEQDGVISFTLPPTDGTTGPQWIKRLEGKGFRLSKWAKKVLNSPDFKPTSGVTYNIAVLKGMIWNDNQRITKNIRADAVSRGLTKPSAEVACMIREMFSDEELEAMGLVWIIAMHEPIKDSDGGPIQLGADRSDGGQRLGATYGRPGRGWDREDGFAFVASQVISTQDLATQN